LGADAVVHELRAAIERAKVILTPRDRSINDGFSAGILRERNLLIGQPSHSTIGFQRIVDLERESIREMSA
jgi:hypothetical protein